MKKVIITGAAKGLGFHLVLQQLERGNLVFALARNITQQLKNVSADNSNLVIIPADVALTESVEAAYLKVRSYTEKIDVIFNNAGVYSHKSKVPVEETDFDEEASRTMNINAFGAMRVIKAFYPMLSRGSVIINISSIAGSISENEVRISEYAYCMSKAALNLASRLLINDFSPKGIRVLCIHPGWMRTDMTRSPEQSTKEMIELFGLETIAKMQIDPGISAANISSIVDDIDSIPKELMFIKHTREEIKW
ncbi:MAG: SDR family NAD(P)-dependent oxidoreductase [Saccharofermentanales bacterium]|jgi:NAD(P)-dependent dehydrogenase (short-subunit alcohol dehydrogenase family)